MSANDLAQKLVEAAHKADFAARRDEPLRTRRARRRSGGSGWCSMNRRRVPWWGACLLALVLTLGGLAVACTPTPEAAPLTGSTWCANKDSLALLGGSSGTGYLTTGYASPDGTYQPTTYGWWSRATNLITQSYGSTAANYSRNGASVASFLPGGQWPITTGAVAEIGRTQPDLVIISLGTNEYLAQLDVAAFEANLGTLVDNIRQASSRTAVLLAIQWTVAKSPVTWSWSQYASAIYRTAVAKRAAMVDLRQYVPYLPAGATDTARLYAADRIHLSDAGHMVVAAAMQSWLFSC